MKPFAVHLGDCLDVLAGMASDSIDSIVTDPPYGLGKEPDALEMLRDWLTTGHHDIAGKGFMGKQWDAFVPQPATWRECLRVLKPGGHLLSFGGSRTHDLVTLGLRIAGFEMRDTIMWLYGSGFPKSLDVSKAIDKIDAAEARRERQLRFTAWIRDTGLTGARIDEITGTNMGGHYTTAASQPAVATREFFEMLRPHFGCEVPAWIEQMVDERTVESENFKRREVIGTGDKPRPTYHTADIGGDAKANEYDITAPQSDAARTWAGWGTALKPAHEPIIVARKPLQGTVAANVLAHGTGAINVDRCRVGEDAGRWPANVLHDGSDEVLAAFPQAPGQLAKASTSNTQRARQNAYGVMARGSKGQEPRDDAGSAARFFYCAKASKADREDANNHPTVKPTALMRWLCRLVTPPGGIVLDPFTGSGSTGKAALLEGLRFVGIEREAEYVAIAEARIAAAVVPAAVPSPQLDMLAALDASVSE